MRILHLAAGNRWTGAAAPAFAEVEALRGAGVEAHYAYVGGYKLEAKIGHLPFAHAAIGKAQNPVSFRRSVRALRALVREHRIDVLHAHLTYDHWLARFVGEGVKLARTFHARRVLRNDPFTKSLIAKTDALFVVNDAFGFAGAVFTPPPVDHRQFHPDGPNVREQYGIPHDAKLLTVIGKLSAGRGFEDALRTLVYVPDTQLMIIGHGEHRPVLEQLARDLQVARRVIFAGYHEADLAEHYRAADLLLFTARGSDEGHRAVLEAMACGVPPATFPIDGMHALVDAENIAPDATPEALSKTVKELLGRDLRARAYERSLAFGYDRAAQRLIAAYATAFAK